VYYDGRVDSEREALNARQDRFEGTLRHELGIQAGKPAVKDQIQALKEARDDLNRRLMALEKRRGG
jgi:hypothetical protein